MPAGLRTRLTIQRRPVRGSIIAACPTVFRHVVEIGPDIGNIYITLQYLYDHMCTTIQLNTHRGWLLCS